MSLPFPPATVTGIVPGVEWTLIVSLPVPAEMKSANFGSGTLWSQGNFNYDNAVNLGDFNLLAANFGQSAGGEDERLPDLEDAVKEN